MHKKHLSILLLVIILAAAIGSVSDLVPENASAATKSRVLYLSSYSPSFETFFRQVDGLQSVFDGQNIVLDIEYMDTKRFHSEESHGHFEALFRYKIDNLDAYDVIIVADDNAADYVMSVKDQLFPDIPIVFMGVNDVEKAKMYSEDPMVTGIVEQISMKETLEMATALNPTAKRIVALSDDTTSGQLDLKIFYDLQADFSHLEMSHINLSSMTFDEFGQVLGQFDKDDIVVRLATYIDVTGKTVTFQEGVQFILDHVSQPVYHTYYWGIPDGLIGGKVVTHFEQGVQAGQIALRILNGEDVAMIDLVLEGSNQYMVNYQVLEAYGYDERVLPDDTIFLNRESTLLQQYGRYILTILVVLLAQAVIILFLVVNVRRRVAAESVLTDHKNRLVSANDLLSAQNEELTSALEEIHERDLEIDALINIDGLTGLKNRFSITNAIQLNIDNDEAKNPFAILFLDVDNFKNINDSYGHDIGDEVIRATGQKLAEFESENIGIGRFGGDEFLILIKGNAYRNHLVPTIEAIKESFSNIITIDRQAFHLTVSMGIALYPEHASDRSDLIKRADLALYEAKAKGKNTFIFYNANMNELITSKVEFQQQVLDGYKNGEFELHYQPYIDIENNRISGFEALIRWHSPELGPVSPYKLILAAEEMGMIVDIGYWVLKEACDFAHEITGNLGKDISISVNISALQLLDNHFVDNTMGIISDSGVDPKYICLEVTETALISSIKEGSNIFARLKEFGVCISLDDFGTGYSSLSYFRDLPLNTLKIDKSFIDNITNEGYDHYLGEIMITLAHKKGLNVIAEGVEEDPQRQVLQSLGCDMIQGYIYSKAMNAKDAVAFLHNWEKNMSDA